MSKNEKVKHAGGCVCGAVRYVTHGPPDRITVCHCLWCQRRTGTAFGVEVVFLEENIEFSGVVPKTHRHTSDESSRWLDMYFCGECGTNLGITLEVRSGIRTIPVGTFDDPDWVEDTDVDVRHVYTRSQRHWGDLNRALKTYEGYFE